jgi:multidrug/hemolysin transport system ATP-binding protein
LLGPTSGSVQVFGVELGVNDEQIRQSIGVVFQQSMLDPGLTVYENLVIRASLYGIKGQAAKEKIQSIAETLGISVTLHQKYKQLSGGQKRKADIAKHWVFSSVWSLHYRVLRLKFVDVYNTKILNKGP